MTGAVGGQRLADIAYRTDFLEVGVHLLVRENRKQSAFCLAVAIVCVFVEDLSGYGKQGNGAVDAGLLTGLAYPQFPFFIPAQVLRAEAVGVDKGKAGQATEYEYVPDLFQSFIGHFFVYDSFQLGAGQVGASFAALHFQAHVLHGVLFEPLVSQAVD